MADQDLDFGSVDTSLLRSPNGYTDSDDHTDFTGMLVDDTQIPDGVVEGSAKPVSDNHIDPKIVVSLLELAASTQGVRVDDVMTNTAVALAHKFGLEANSMEWFLAGITFANNNMLLEKMKSAISDLQTEVRNIQVASNSVKTNSAELTSKLKSNRADITKELDKTRDSVLSALGSMAIKTTSNEPVGELVTVGISHGKKKKSTDHTVPPPQPINPELITPTLTKVISVKSPDEKIYFEKEKLLIDLGFGLEDIAGYSPLAIDFIITDNMLEVASAGLTEEIKDALQNQAIDNQIAVETMSDLMAGPSGTK
ncbi:putative P protein [Trifolium pratense virus B]|uniref:Putative P protein n=1 Tax=Trifolium pratense virus B TaxID=2448907 RepID=A0A510C2C4_9RHAB|nr:putative P protein [Trifolium pratense virus B]AYH53269.1 putative P protein [Trifolium pratense virus B]